MNFVNKHSQPISCQLYFYLQQIVQNKNKLKINKIKSKFINIVTITRNALSVMVN